MYYAQELFVKTGKYGRIWLAGTLFSKLTRSDILAANIVHAALQILHPAVKLALSAQARLTLGAVRIHHRKEIYLLHDALSADFRLSRPDTVSHSKKPLPRKRRRKNETNNDAEKERPRSNKRLMAKEEEITLGNQDTAFSLVQERDVSSLESDPLAELGSGSFNDENSNKQSFENEEEIGCDLMGEGVLDEGIEIRGETKVGRKKRKRWVIEDKLIELSDLKIRSSLNDPKTTMSKRHCELNVKSGRLGLLLNLLTPSSFSESPSEIPPVLKEIFYEGENVISFSIFQSKNGDEILPRSASDSNEVPRRINHLSNSQGDQIGNSLSSSPLPVSNDEVGLDAMSSHDPIEHLDELGEDDWIDKDDEGKAENEINSKEIDTFDAITKRQKTKRREMAKLFYEILAKKTNGEIEVIQNDPFEDIEILKNKLHCV